MLLVGYLPIARKKMSLRVLLFKKMNSAKKIIWRLPKRRPTKRLPSRQGKNSFSEYSSKWWNVLNSSCRLFANSEEKTVERVAPQEEDELCDEDDMTASTRALCGDSDKESEELEDSAWVFLIHFCWFSTDPCVYLVFSQIKKESIRLARSCLSTSKFCPLCRSHSLLITCR